MVKLKTSILLVIYLGCLYIWCLPFISNPYPYGSVDGATYLQFGDYMGLYDKPIYKLPEYFGRQELNDKKLWHAPTYYIDMALSELTGGYRFQSIFFFIAFTNSIIFFSVYLLIKKLYGFLPALITASMATLSLRSLSFNFMGHWQHLASISFLPLIIYCYYRYTESYIKNETKPAYIIIAAILTASQFLFHTLFFLHTIFFIVTYTLVLTIIHKKLVFSIKHALISILVFAAITLPYFLQFSYGVSVDTASQTLIEPFKLTTLYWGIDSKPYEGMMYPGWFDFYQNHNGAWIIAPTILGIIILLIRRKENDIVLLSWLLSYYLLIDFVPFLGFLSGYGHKSLVAEAYALYPFAVLSFFLFPSFIKHPKVRTFLKYGLVSLLVALVLFINVPPTLSINKTPELDISRLTKPEYDAAEWLRLNIKDNSIKIVDVGTIEYGKKRMIGMVANKLFLYDSNIIPEKILEEQIGRLVFIDYSDIAFTKQEDLAKQLKQWELTVFSNYTKIYESQMITIYDLEKPK